MNESTLPRKFDTNARSVLKLLQYKEDLGLRRSPDYLTIVKPLTQKILEVLDNRSTLQTADENNPFLKFAILDNKEKQTQIVIVVDGKSDAKLDKPPFSLTIRLLYRKKREVTKVRYTFGQQGRVTNDFEKNTDLSDERLSDFEGKFCLKNDPETPEKYNIDFLEEVLDSIKDAQINLELQQEVFNYMTTG